MALSPQDIIFYVFAALGAIFAIRVVTAANPITAAFSLVMTFFCVAAIYALMDAHFIAAIQVLVYAGAVMVLFTFVIMLLNADEKVANFKKEVVYKSVAILVVGVLFTAFNWFVRHGEVSTTKRGLLSSSRISELGGNVRVLSELMFSDFILPFELTSILLLVGIIGSVALAKRAKRVK